MRLEPLQPLVDQGLWKHDPGPNGAKPNATARTLSSDPNETERNASGLHLDLTANRAGGRD